MTDPSVTTPTPNPGRAPVDQAARDRIRDALSETLFVEAGAGTGKTTQLVARVVNLVVVEGIGLASIAAITFTEAAASELRDRIREALERTASDDRATDLERARSSAALGEIDMAAISTLHAFAHRVLSEHPIAAGLPPRVEVLDEVRSQLAFEQRWDAFVDDLMADPRHEALVVRAARIGVRIEATASGQASLKDVARILGQHWDRLDTLLADEPEGPPPAVDRGPLLAAIDAVRALDRGCSAPDDCGLQQHLDGLEPFFELLAAGSDDDALSLVAGSGVTWTTGQGNLKHCVDPGAIRDALKEVKAAAEAERGRLIDDAMRRFGAELALFTQRHAAQRAADGALEFHDLLVLARRLVRSDPAARGALGERYQRLLLDEFQDTDPIQIELAALVASAVDDGVDWTAVEPDPGRLFFVGDAKQSIYRFRRADIRVFMAARDRFAAGRPVELTENFRTLPPIIDWVNRFFGEVMVEQPGRQPGYGPLSAFRADDSGSDHRPILMGGPHPDLKAAQIRELEAADVARALRDIQDHPEAWPVHDRAGNAWRPARMDDVAVLIPARTSLRFLEKALRAMGVAYRVDTGSLVYDTQEVVELLSVLRVIDDPADSIALVAALRSPLFGCGDDELALYRQAGGTWDLTAAVPDELVDHRVGRSVAWLSGLHHQRWWRDPSALLLQIIEERRAFELAFAHDRPRDIWRRLRFLVDQARLFEESEGGDLRDFLAWAELQRHEASRVHEPVLPEADDRSARIMTIHGAKGLEFPITVVSGLSTESGTGRTGPAIVWADDGSAATKLSSSARTDNFDVIADFEAEMEEGERLRLLYVALTRARDHLLVTTHHKPLKNGAVKSFAHRISVVMADEGDRHRSLDEVLSGERSTLSPLSGLEEVATSPAFDGPPDGAGRAERLRSRAEALAQGARPATVSATTVASLADGSAPAGPAGPADPDDERALFRRGRAGTPIGRAVHAVLQHGDLAAGTDLDGLARAAAAAEAVPHELAAISARVRSARQSATVQAALAAPRHWRELHVSAPVDGQTVEGYVDLLYEDGDGLVVVDYKTDSLRGPADVEAKVARYRLQGATYAVALEAATGRPVNECRFVFATDGDAVERSVTDLDRAKAEARALIGAQSSSP